MDLNIGLAFLGGLASFFSPCVLSIVPVYIGYLGGYSFTQSDPKLKTSFRPIVFWHGVVFVLGFSLVFITMGMTISLLGGYLVFMRWWLIRIAGIVLIVFGLHLAQILHIGWFDYEFRYQPNSMRENNLVTSFLVGVFFAAGWTPCLGPILGAILALTLQAGSIYNGLIYLCVYSLGMGIPFLFTCLFLERVSVFVRKNIRVSMYIEKSMGYLMVVIGLLFLSGLYDIIFQRLIILRLG